MDLLDRVLELIEGGEGDASLAFPLPGDLAKHIDARTIQTPALQVLDQALVAAANGEQARLIFTMPPQEGKTQRVSRTLPLWLLHRNPDLRIGIVSYAEDLAISSAGQVKMDVEEHPELGLILRPDTRAKGEWKLKGHDGGIIARGIGGGLTGRPLDVLIIDDPFKDRKEANSEVFRKRAWDWWTEVGSARLGRGSIVIVIMTRWHEDDLAGRLVAQDKADGVSEWKLINVPAQADHNPDAGQNCRCAGQECGGPDVLGRAPGEYMISARGRTTRDWDQRKRAAGSFAWSALYQGHPSPGEGGVFKRAWWRRFHEPRWVVKDDGTRYVPGEVELELHVDCAFKDADSSDFVAMGVWAKRYPRIWLADIVNEHLDLIGTVDRILELRARWPQIRLVVVEDKANGPAVIQVLRRRVPGVLEYEPKDSKLARAYAAQPFVEAGDVEIPSPDLLPSVGDFLEQCASFPQGAHDDLVDQMTQAVDRMLIKPGDDPFMRQLLAERGGASIIDQPHIPRPWTPQGPFADDAPAAAQPAPEPDLPGPFAGVFQRLGR